MRNSLLKKFNCYGLILTIFTAVVTTSLFAAGGGEAVPIPRAVRADTTIHHYEYVLTDGRIYVYDIDNAFHLIDSIAVPTTQGTRGVSVSQSDGLMYISYRGDGGFRGNGSMLQLNLLTKTIGWTKNYSHGVDSHEMSIDGKIIYSPDGELSGDGKWYLIDANDGSETGAVINTSTPGPHNTIVSLDGSRVYMGDRDPYNVGSDYFYVANTANDSVIKAVGPIRKGIRPFTVNGKGTFAYITTTGMIGFQVGDLTTGHVPFTVDLSTMGFTITRCFTDGFTGNNCQTSHGISLSPDETKVYVIDSPNSYVHVFDVSGVENNIAPKKIKDIHLNHPLLGQASNCAYDCLQIGWLQHSIDGRYVFVGDAGDVISTANDSIIAFIPQLRNTRKCIEVDWQNGVAIANSTRQGVGRITGNSAPPPPILVSPANGSTGEPTNPQMIWRKSNTALSYRVQLAADSLFATIVHDSSTADTSLRFLSLSGGTAYFWRAAAQNSDGTSLWSAQWKFISAGSAPIAPVLISLPDGSTGEPPTVWLGWHSSIGAQTYRVEAATDSLFNSIVIDDSSVTDTSKQLTLLADTTKYYWRVNAKNNSGTSPWSARWWFVTDGLTASIDVQMRQGWNMVAVPVVVSGYTTATIFPDAASKAFTYSGGYMAKDTLANGTGYWIKYIRDTVIRISGSTASSCQTDVVPGWNMIGPISAPIPAANISSIPEGIVTSQFFGYNGIFQQSDTLKPGNGYWVKVGQSGRLMFSASTIVSEAGRIRIIPVEELPPFPPNQAASNPSSVPQNYALEQAYPNPFNPTTSINYQLPYESRVSLKIYDMLGQLIATLTDGVRNAGYESVQWTPNNLASGIYFYRLEAASVANPGTTFSQVRKMLLMK
jgi:DNA-binding beta-propeller fold protein YncE